MTGAPPRLGIAMTAAALLGSLTTIAPAGADDGTGDVVAVPYIVGGSEVTDPSDTPWLAAVLNGAVNDPYSAQFCTGTLLSPSHVLTAGHCVKDSSGQPVVANFEVVVGILDLDEVTDADRHPATATAHPAWTGSDGVDLAILTLDTPLVDAEPLMIRSAGPAVNDTVAAYGWGGTLETDRDNNSYPTVAHEGTMTVTTDYDSTTNCGYGPPDPVSPDPMEQSHQFCFGDPDQAACFGDSGGPVVMFDGSNPFLVGATSQGPTTCNLNAVDEVAERVIDSLTWIESFIGPAGCSWNPNSMGLDTYEGWTVPCWLPPASGAALPFLDVNFTFFYIDGVKWLWSNQITTGTSATTFSPDDAVTRGQLAAFLWRFAGEPAAVGTPFSDIQSGWQQVPVAWLAQWGITTGTSATTFSPDDIVTRGQLVTFLWRLLGEPAPTGPAGFSDVPAGRFYSDALAWAAENGITTGYGDGTFRPDQPVTRGEMATFLLRLALLVEALAPPA